MHRMICHRRRISRETMWSTSCGELPLHVAAQTICSRLRCIWDLKRYFHAYQAMGAVNGMTRDICVSTCIQAHFRKMPVACPFAGTGFGMLWLG